MGGEMRGAWREGTERGIGEEGGREMRREGGKGDEGRGEGWKGDEKGRDGRETRKETRGGRERRRGEGGYIRKTYSHPRVTKAWRHPAGGKQREGREREGRQEI